LQDRYKNTAPEKTATNITFWKTHLKPPPTRFTSKHESNIKLERKKSHGNKETKRQN
jgi:hypothetical protein